MSQSARIITAADLKQITPVELASLLRDPTTASQTAVIDVRDSDHLGGHIRGSSWVPTSELEARIPELIRLHRDKHQVVFHCMLSQQRGPSSALKFTRALARASASATEPTTQGHATAAAQQSPLAGAQADGQAEADRLGDSHQRPPQQQQSPPPPTNVKQPEVYVLEGGFGMWASRFGEDASLTEAFVKDLWE